MKQNLFLRFYLLETHWSNTNMLVSDIIKQFDVDLSLIIFPLQTWKLISNTGVYSQHDIFHKVLLSNSKSVICDHDSMIQNPSPHKFLVWVNLVMIWVFDRNHYLLYLLILIVKNINLDDQNLGISFRLLLHMVMLGYWLLFALNKHQKHIITKHSALKW